MLWLVNYAVAINEFIVSNVLRDNGANLIYIITKNGLINYAKFIKPY